MDAAEITLGLFGGSIPDRPRSRKDRVERVRA
jgi:hypothetical protein